MSFSQAFSSRSSELPNLIRRHTHALNSNFLDHLAHEVARRNSRVVCIGEASHGTHEFYLIRAELTKRLIAEYGFDGVCIEGDWPDAWRVNQYVQGRTGPSADANANESLQDFRRFPTWMWRNRVVENFVEWLRQHNDLVKQEQQAQQLQPQEAGPTIKHTAGFYGMDLYSLYTSVDAVISYLSTVDEQAAHRARERFACFEQGGKRVRDAHLYGRNAAFNISKSCEDAVIAQLYELQQERIARGTADGDEFFCAHLNALLVKDAENYYRGMFLGDEPSWNLRDQHMANTVHELIDYIASRKRELYADSTDSTVQPTARLVLWAHNSHLGDARATDMGTERGELNVGQLMREAFGDASKPLGSFNIGFTSYSGTVTAAHNWDMPDQHMTVNPGRRGSYEELMHQAGEGSDFGIIIRGNQVLEHALTPQRLERAIGVIYRPRTEMQSHYFYAHLAQQFDALLHVDRSHAIEPLEPMEHWMVARTEHLSLNPDHVPKQEAFNYQPGPRTLKAPFVYDHGHIPPETYPHNF